MRVGDSIVCIKGVVGLKRGKVYEIKQFTKIKHPKYNKSVLGLVVINEMGFHQSFHFFNFKDLAKHRKEVIENILN